MKTIKILFIAALFFTSINAQKNSIIIEANGNYYLPTGALAERFNGTFGGSFLVGKQVSDNWTWLGKFEYFKLTDLNKDKLVRKVGYTFNDVEQTAEIPLTNLNMELTVAGLSVEARMKVLSTDIFESDINLGFGFLYWENKRGGYFDSLYVNPNDTTQILVDVIQVPAQTQIDWSGAVNLGVNISVKLFEPVWFNASANYKLIIGELWPALSLDIENVSGIQLFDFRTGFQIRL
jgi:hypothetical protein